DGAGVDAEPERHVGTALLALGYDPALHLERALDGFACLIFFLEGRAPKDHDVVPVELVHGAFVAIHDVHHTVEVPVEVAEENPRSESLRNCREPADVPEDDRDALFLSAQGELAGFLAIDDGPRNRRRDETTECASG